MLDLTSTRWYVVRKGTPTEKHLATQARAPQRTGTVIHSRPQVQGPSGGVALYERTSALPRAYYVAFAHHARGPTEALDLLQSRDFHPRSEVVLEGAPRKPESGIRANAFERLARITEDEHERVVIEVDAPAAGYVVLTDAHRPGWRATLDGAPVPIYTANGLFRAVPVPPGDHEIVMTYRSTPFERGLIIGGVSLIILAGIGWRTRRRTRLLQA